MGLQTSALVMRALGVSGDAPKVADQPTLVDGVHLRWSVSRERGFPWHGFYLFRRPSNLEDKRTCLEPSLFGLELGQGKDVWHVTGGRLSSPTPLVFTDDFPNSGYVEVDLRGRAFIRFDRPAQNPMKQVWVRIGIRNSFLGWRSTRFDGPTDLLRMPFEQDGLRLAVAREGGETGYAGVSGEERGDGGLIIDEPIVVTLPELVDRVELELSGLSGPAMLEGLDRAGNLLGQEAAEGKDGVDWKLALSIEGLHSLRIIPRGKNVKLKCLSFGSADKDTRSFRVEALASGPEYAQGDVVVAVEDATGVGGDTVEVQLQADQFTAVRISGGDGALIDICWTEPDHQMTDRWEPVPQCPQPITLPLSHPHYPARTGPIDLANAQYQALVLVRYGSPVVWAGQNFQQIHDACVALVKGGPAIAMNEDARASKLLANSQPPGEKLLSMPKLHPLDMLMVGSLHRPIAEMLGLSWTDQSVHPGDHFDYMIVADHADVSGGKPDNMLTHLLTAGFNDSVDAWISYNVEVVSQPAFQPPHDVVVYALPGGVMRDAGGVVSNIAGSVGVDWPGRLTSEGWPGTDEPVAHHLYRSRAGQAETPNIPSEAGDWLTKDRPVLYARPVTPPKSPPQTPPTWPPHDPAYIDLKLEEGWYVYQLVALDIFGRFSPKSPFATWWQWSPQPVPRPWYYIGASSEAVVHSQAVRILNHSRPPIPLGLEAFVLDPGDPLLVKDKAYRAWRKKKGAPGACITGLRVRWRWGPGQQKRAPDVTEFRLYWSPNSAPPSGWAEPEAWPNRFFVCAFEDNVEPKLDGTRKYEVFLQCPSANGVPFMATLSDPIAYANVSVTATATADQTLDRESQCAPPQKVFLVWRTQPSPPEAVLDSERVYATPADWHGRSYHTFRWVPQENLCVHVWRALDEAVFVCDWTLQPRQRLDVRSPTFLNDNDNDEPIWSSERKSTVAVEINAIVDLAKSAADKAVVKDKALALYRALSDDALRVLANLAGNNRAFVQVTVTPLSASATADRRGPDDVKGYVPQAGRCAYVDQINGRASNRLLYRSQLVDAAHNRSDLGPCSTPVHVPDITSPRPPTITKALGGERSVTLTWVPNREADLEGYQVYRAERAVDARDIRTMTLMSTIPHDLSSACPSCVSYTDNKVPGLRDLWYRIVAIDQADAHLPGYGGNVSLPSPAIRVRAFDSTPPQAPVIKTVKWVLVDGERVVGSGHLIPDTTILLPAIQLEWDDPDSQLRVLVQARPVSVEAFTNLSGWLALGTTHAVVRSDWTFEQVEVRLKVVNAAGNVNMDFLPALLCPVT